MGLKQLNNANLNREFKPMEIKKIKVIIFCLKSDKEQQSFQSLKGEQVAFRFVLYGFGSNLAGHPMWAFLAKAQRRGDNSQ